MSYRVFIVALTGVVATANAASIAYDKVQPIAQPKPVTISEKAGVKFKPQLFVDTGCFTFPAVNAAGETSSGLPAEQGNYFCVKRYNLLGSQVYGRATWYKGVWAIMYAWYYPKTITALVATATHDWQNAVVWINNPDLESPKIMGLSTSKKSETDHTKPHITRETFKSDVTYDKRTKDFDQFLDGTSFKLASTLILGPIFLRPMTEKKGEFQDLVMWSQLPDVARAALNSTEIGNVPFSDANFQKKLAEAWPF
ncbi:hypothetical protein L917_14690 [Phytophthora nicotianae]|uniref:Necrosis inducing protein NPP1 n=1 Tax=Phytophthora nicotianae TaxID=4792 RepID=W2KL91_PHYNI|nr:hypothetical protein L917_14690 [Phytophthora nicotianae]